jgi:hypothetical protein
MLRAIARSSHRERQSRAQQSCGQQLELLNIEFLPLLQTLHERSDVAPAQTLQRVVHRLVKLLLQVMRHRDRMSCALTCSLVRSHRLAVAVTHESPFLDWRTYARRHRK